MNKRHLTIFFFLAFISLSAKEYQVDKTKTNLVKFISDAPIEEFEGVSNNIDGYIYLKSFDDLSESKIYFEVDLNTLDTGIGLRNRHMRDNYLETDIYQYTYFEGTFNSISQIDTNSFSVEISGELFIHGVSKPVTIVGKMIKSQTGFKITSTFKVKLTDYKIDVPEMMFMKIDETMVLQLDFNIKAME